MRRSMQPLEIAEPEDEVSPPVRKRTDVPTPIRQMTANDLHRLYVQQLNTRKYFADPKRPGDVGGYERFPFQISPKDLTAPDCGYAAYEPVLLASGKPSRARFIPEEQQPFSAGEMGESGSFVSTLVVMRCRHARAARDPEDRTGQKLVWADYKADTFWVVDYEAGPEGMAWEFTHLGGPKAPQPGALDYFDWRRDNRAEELAA